MGCHKKLQQIAVDVAAQMLIRSCTVDLASMREFDVLFICADNTIYSPVAEALLNLTGNGFVRGFSAGLEPGRQLNPHARRFLKKANVEYRGLTPKSVDVFLLPHAPIPDLVVSLAGASELEWPEHWKHRVRSETWTLDGAEEDRVQMSEESFRHLQVAVARLQQTEAIRAAYRKAS